MRYHYRTADGKTCCHADSLDALCSACRAQARSQSPTTASRALRVAASRDEIPPPPCLNAAIRAAEAKRQSTPAPRATAPTPEMRAAAVRANMRPPAPPEDVTPAMRAASRRAYAVEHDVPPAISNAEFNRRIVERAR